MAKCPICEEPVEFRRLPLSLGLPTWKCQECDHYLEWQEPESTKVGLLCLFSAVLIWWLAGLLIGSPDSLISLVLWMAWSVLAFFGFAYSWNRYAPVAVVSEAPRPSANPEPLP